MLGETRTTFPDASLSPVSTGFNHRSSRLPEAADSPCRSASPGTILLSVTAHVPATEIATRTPAAIIPGRPPDLRTLRLPPNFNPPPSLQGVETLNGTHLNRSYPFPHGRRLKTLAVRPGNPVFSARKSIWRSDSNEQIFCSLPVEWEMTGVFTKTWAKAHGRRRMTGSIARP